MMSSARDGTGNAVPSNEVLLYYTHEKSPNVMFRTNQILLKLDQLWHAWHFQIWWSLWSFLGFFFEQQSVFYHVFVMFILQQSCLVNTVFIYLFHTSLLIQVASNCRECLSNLGKLASVSQCTFFGDLGNSLHKVKPRCSSAFQFWPLLLCVFKHKITI